jgi:hypothetical protein
MAAGGHCSDATLENGGERRYNFDTTHERSIAVKLSKPILRKKLTELENGRFTIFKPDKFYPEEICENPRRIIALYASLARHFMKFAEKLLIDNFNMDVTKDPQTFVSMPINALMSMVSQSKDVYDYYGFTIAVSSLLSSLSTPYKKYSHNGIIDSTLYEFCEASFPRVPMRQWLLLLHILRFALGL